ncbi:MAG: hypothetical protein QXR45_01455 [Candidatus Bathyarchaeia archaeon]
MSSIISHALFNPKLKCSAMRYNLERDYKPKAPVAKPLALID